MQAGNKGMNLVVIADDPARATLLHSSMQTAGVNGVVRRISPGHRAIDCARRAGCYREQSLPDLIFLDFAEPDEKTFAILSDIAFGENRAHVPVVLLTSANSWQLLESGSVGDEAAVMFSPTSLPSFVSKMRNGNRTSFLKALKTLYQYGPILVRLPSASRHFDRRVSALSA